MMFMAHLMYRKKKQNSEAPKTKETAATVQ
jgi:hypothetical protein